jgi:hypothetical protein
VAGFALSLDVALHSGVYSFMLNPADVDTKLVQVRLQAYDSRHVYVDMPCCGNIVVASCADHAQEVIAKLSERPSTVCTVLCVLPVATVVLHAYWLITRCGFVLQTVLPQARFTFLYRKYNGRWLIAEHHSSAMPDPVLCTGLVLPIVLPQARFTFLYRKYNGRWLIAEHHSSAMPEQKPAGVEEMFDKWNAALQVSLFR